MTARSPRPPAAPRARGPRKSAGPSSVSADRRPHLGSPRAGRPRGCHLPGHLPRHLPGCPGAQPESGAGTAPHPGASPCSALRGPPESPLPAPRARRQSSPHFPGDRHRHPPALRSPLPGRGRCGIQAASPPPGPRRGLRGVPGPPAPPSGSGTRAAGAGRSSPPARAPPLRAPGFLPPGDAPGQVNAPTCRPAGAAGAGATSGTAAGTASPRGAGTRGDRAHASREGRGRSRSAAVQTGGSCRRPSLRAWSLGEAGRDLDSVSSHRPSRRGRCGVCSARQRGLGGAGD